MQNPVVLPDYLSRLDSLFKKDFDNILSGIPKPVDYSTLSEAELIEHLKQSPDFDKLVFPNSWYSKYNLPVKKAMDTKEYIKESPWTKRHCHWYVGQEEIKAKPGGNRPVLPPPEVPTLLILENSFSDAPKDQSEISNPSDSQQS